MSPQTKTPQPDINRLAEAINKFLVPAIQRLPKEVVAEMLKHTKESA